MTDAERLQRSYYSRTAAAYDANHISDADEHQFNLHFLSGMLPLLSASSILDVGAGSGRAVTFLAEQQRQLHVVGIEPVAELIERAVAKGFPASQLLVGVGGALPFPDRSFDVVCSFGVLHHVADPDTVVAEMLRVARKAIFISDSNILGQGSRFARLIKRSLWSLGLWKTFDSLRTGGKRYHVSEGDGVFYSYSIYQNFAQIREACISVHTVNATTAMSDLKHSASHIGLLGLLR